MPSENKTKNIGLNQWQGNEYVKRQDFVNDNEIIDREIKKLIDNIGDKSSLNTENKTNLVAAINEVLTKFGSIKLEADNVTIKDIENLFTSDKVEGALKEAITEAKSALSKANANETSIQSAKDDIQVIQNELGTNRLDLINSSNEIIDILK